MKIMGLFLSKNLRSVHRELREVRETLDRLEIAQRRYQTNQDALSGDIEMLSDRIAKVAGKLGGAPRNAKGRVVRDSPPPISEIPRGDKAALRKALGIGIVKPTTNDDQE